MAGISTTNAESPEKELLSGRVALVSGVGGAIVGRSRIPTRRLARADHLFFSTVADAALSALVGPCAAGQSTPSNWLKR